MFRDDDGMNAAANAPGRFDLHPPGLKACDQIVQQHVCHVFIVDTLGSKRLEVELEALEFDAHSVCDVLNSDLAEVRLPCLGA